MSNAATKAPPIQDWRQLSDAIDASVIGDRRTLVREYVKLLYNPADGGRQIDRLKTLMEKLGKSTDDAKADLVNLNRVRTYCTAVVDGAGASDAAAEANRAVMDHHAHMVKVQEELKTEHARLNGIVTKHSELERHAREAAFELEKLTTSNPELLEAIDLPDCSEYGVNIGRRS